ncbi:MAG: hypothetical protein QM669_12450 [Siphonobacter sp.]
MERTFTREQLRLLLKHAQDDFLTEKQRRALLDYLVELDGFEGLSRKTVGEYLGSKMKHATYVQLYWALQWIRARIGEANYALLLQLSLSEPQAA